MGRTISSFRWQIDQEKERWRQVREYLDKEGKRLFDGMFVTARKYVSASMMACRLDPIEAIFMSIMFDHYKATSNGIAISSKEDDEYENDYKDQSEENNTASNAENSTLSNDDLESEIKSWEKFADTLRDKDKKLFYDMLKKARKYATAVKVRKDGFSQEILFMSILLLQHKILNDSGIYRLQNNSRDSFVSL